LVCSVSIGKHTRSQVGDDFSGSLENHWEVKFGDGYNFSRTNRVEGRFVIPDEMEFYWWPAFWPDWRDAFNGDEGIATATFGASRNIATPNNYDRIAYIQGPSSNTGFPDYISTKPLECRIGMLSLKSGRFVIWSQAIDVDDVYYYLNYYTEGDILADLSIGGENNPRICATSGNKYMGMIAQSVR
jgi:hypothetical protein